MYAIRSYYVGIGFENNTFSLKNINPALNHFFVKFHIWNTVHQQTTNTVVAFEYGNSVTCFV